MSTTLRTTEPSDYLRARAARSDDVPAMLAMAVHGSRTGVYSPMIAANPVNFQVQLVAAVDSGFYPVETETAILMTRCFIRVVELDDNVVGFTVALVDPKQTRLPDAIVIECLMLSVDRDYERRGVGRLLMTQVLEETKERGGVVRFCVRCLPAALSPAMTTLLRTLHFARVRQAPNGVVEFEAIP